MSETVISCRKVHFHVISRGCTKPDMNMIFGDMKLLPPDMNTQNNFMSGKCEFHVAEKVNFPDDRKDLKMKKAPKKRTSFDRKFQSRVQQSLNSDQYRLCCSRHGPYRAWGLSWINKERDTHTHTRRVCKSSANSAIVTLGLGPRVLRQICTELFWDERDLVQKCMIW